MFATAFMGNVLTPRNGLISDGKSGTLSGRGDGMLLSESLGVVADPGVGNLNMDNLSLWPEISFCPSPSGDQKGTTHPIPQTLTAPPSRELQAISLLL